MCGFASLSLAQTSHPVIVELISFTEEDQWIKVFRTTSYTETIIIPLIIYPYY